MIAFALPVFVISIKTPATCGYFMTVNDYRISREELWTWILATPVQFISGAPLASSESHVGMSFLIDTGMTAAYFYLVSAVLVLYNAMNVNSGRPRLMALFESSLLLTSFVLLMR